MNTTLKQNQFLYACRSQGSNCTHFVGDSWWFSWVGKKICMKTIQMNPSVSIFRPLTTKSRSDDNNFCTLNTILRHLKPWVKSDGKTLFVTRTCWWQRRLANAWMLGFRHLWMASSENKLCVRSAVIFGDWDAKLNLGSEATVLKHMNWWYCWWKKSCTTWDI